MFKIEIKRYNPNLGKKVYDKVKASFIENLFFFSNSHFEMSTTEQETLLCYIYVTFAVRSFSPWDATRFILAKLSLKSLWNEKDADGKWKHSSASPF